MRKIFTFILTLAAGFTFLVLPVSASEEFDTEYIVNYDIAPNGETTVTYDISIINNRSDVVATKYSLSIRQMSIYDVSGNDRRGPLSIETETEDDIVTIIAELNEQVVGEGRRNDFKISYKTRSVANKVGEVWNVNIAQIQNLELTNKYDVVLSIPKSFGPRIFVSPNPLEESDQNDRLLLTYDRDSLLNRGISSSFGEYQVVNFRIRYQLKNDSIFSSVQEVALPPDIEKRQSVNYYSINPRPVNVKQDADGNVLAYFKVDARSEMEVVLTGSARIWGEQIDPKFGGKMDELPRNLVNRYTKEARYWEVSAPEVQEIAEKLYNDGLTVAQNAFEIYEFVTSYLQYDFEISTDEYIERKGALQALREPETSACMEFTDLFIAVARAMGIPARELNGYAFNNTDEFLPLSIDLKGGDLLHAWPEFYDPKFGWIGIDPTWGSTSGMDYFTKLDTNHVAFVIKGQSSEYPLPAGAYRTNDTEKLIEIDFSRDSNQEFGQISAYEQAQNLVDKRGLSMINYVGIFFLALGLCTILYLLIIHPDYPRRLTDRLRRRPQDPDQQPNQNS
jgi:transglutaminase-like putative cysteine protease